MVSSDIYYADPPTPLPVAGGSFGVFVWKKEAPASMSGTGAGWAHLEYIDSLYEPASLEIWIADPGNTRLAVWSQPYMLIKMVERITGVAIFFGRVTYVEPKYDSELGSMIKVTAYDYLHELRETWMRQNQIDVLTHSNIVKMCVRAGSYNRLQYVGAPLVINFTPGYWVEDRLPGGLVPTGLYANIVSEDTTNDVIVVKDYYHVPDSAAPMEFATGNELWQIQYPPYPNYQAPPASVWKANAGVGWGDAGVAVWRRLLLDSMQDSSIAPPTYNGLLTVGPLYSGVGGSCLDEISWLANLDQYFGWAGNILMGSMLFCKPRNSASPYELSADLAYFNRGRYLGVSADGLYTLDHGLWADPYYAWTESDGLVVQHGGTPPQWDPVTHPVADSYYGRWLPMSSSYEFAPTYAGEMITRVQFHWQSPDGAAQQTLVTVPGYTSGVEDSKGTIREVHVYNLSISTIADATALATKIIIGSFDMFVSQNGIMRGTFQVPGYPTYMRGAPPWPSPPPLVSRFYLRAGCQLFIRHDHIAAIDSKGFLVEELRYSEPECITTLCVMPAAGGLERDVGQ